MILALAADAEAVRPQVEKAVNDFAARGFRSLGVARADGDGPWRFLGVLPLYDPPRPDSRPTIATARQMGIEVKMVTGDQVAIAKEIARQVGLGANILDAAFRRDEADEVGRLADAIEQADGFAQVFPEHKFHIVDVLQQRDHIVGMTGDGVNDAPALKKADAGIAVSGATDAARAAADIVLLTPGLSVIIDAIKESRKIFQRMNSYAIYRIAETIRVLLFMTLSILVFNFYPVTAVMIVLLALLNDGAILSIAYDRVHYSDQPEAWNMRLVLGLATVLGIAGVFASFGLFYLAEEVFHLIPTACPDPHVPEALGGGAPDDFRHPHARPVLVDSARADPAWRRDRHAGDGHADCRLRPVMTPIGWAWALLVWGLCPGLVPGQRPREAGGLPRLRSAAAPTAGDRPRREAFARFRDSRLTYALPLPSEERAACDPRPSCAEPPISMNASRPVCPRRHFSQET